MRLMNWMSSEHKHAQKRKQQKRCQGGRAALGQAEVVDDEAMSA